MKRGKLLPAVAVVATLAVPTTATAATSVDLGGDRLAVTGDAFRNDIEVRRVGDGYVVTDTAANLSIVAGSDCFFSDPPREVRCRTGSEVEVTIEGRAAADELTMTGGIRRAIIDGGDGTDRLVGGPGPDRLVGGPNGDALLGSNGNDVLIGEAGPDSLQGGTGTDTVSYADRVGDVKITLPVDSFDERADDGNLTDGPVAGARDAINDDVENAIGGDGADSILGNNARNSLRGGRNADVITGRSGDDVLEGGTGPDILNGNDGVDVAVYDDHVQPLSLSLDNVANDGNPAEDVILNVGPGADNIRFDVEGVIGGQGPDAITGNDGPNRLDGGDGDDTIDGRGGADSLDGDGGDDALDGGFGPDGIDGGSGEDTLSYSTRTEAVRVTMDDVADDGNGQDQSSDNAAGDIENLIGTVGDDLLRGNNAANALEGRAGNDQLEGLSADDTLDGAAGSDVLDGGTGTDTATFANTPGVNITLDGVANDVAVGGTIGPNVDNVLTENVIGSPLADTITGNDARNVLNGGGGADVIRGAGGNDDIVGGNDEDVLFGDAGNDTLLANDGVRDQVSCGADIDVAGLDLVDVDSNVKGGAVLAGSAGCESQSIAPVGRLPNVAVGKSVRVGQGRARVKLRCPRQSDIRCKGALRLQRLDGTVLARGRFAIRKGKRATLRLALQRPAGRGAARILARERDTDGRPKLTLARVRLAPRP